jgi:hypothetical protein
MKRRLFLVGGTLASLATACVWRSSVGPSQSFLSSFDPPLSEPDARSVDSANRLAARKELYIEHVEPAIRDADAANQDAAQRAVNTLWDTLNGYRRGIGPFCDELLSYSTRLGVLSRVPGDWWYNRDSIGPYVHAKFAHHLFTDAKIEADIQRAIQQFYEDENANRNSMIIRVKLAMSQSDFPELPNIDVQHLASKMSQQIEALSQEAGIKSSTNMILAELAGEGASMLAKYFLTQVTVRFANMAASSIAAAGGTSVASTTGGAGMGSMAGPLGTATGIAAGLVVGMIIDHWMSSHYRQHVCHQINGMIDVLLNEVVSGDSEGNEEHGFTSGLAGCCRALNMSYSNTFQTILLGPR